MNKWLLIAAEGEDLGGHDDPKRKLDGDIEEIYVYNDSYMKDLTTSPRKMALSDLFDSSIVGLYASDPVWSKRHMVKLPYQKNQQELFDDHERKSPITESSYDKWLYMNDKEYDFGMTNSR